MRMNGPVTNTEYVLPDDEVIITHTDPDSRITYANPAFLSSSEFSLEECLGQPQNIVRHPDMPREAFADLWQTIRAGKSWTGIVKNRRKSGGFYWVRANVTPMMDGGRIVGYMSVRVKPSRDEVVQAERIYANIRAGHAGSLRIREGRVVDVSIRGIADVIAEIEVASREQSAGIEQINRAMTQMDKITQQDAQMAQELSETAQSLQRQSQQMLAAISAFSMQATHASRAELTTARQESRTFARAA